MGTTENITFYIAAALIGALLVFVGAYVGYWKGRMHAFFVDPIGCDECGSCGHSGCCDGNTCKVIHCKFGGMYTREFNELCDQATKYEKALNQAIRLGEITVEDIREDFDSVVPRCLSEKGECASPYMHELREYLESIRPKFIAGDRVRCHMAPLDEVYTIQDSCRVGDKWIYDIGDGCGLDYDEEDIDREPTNREGAAQP